MMQGILVNDPGKTQDGKTCERERASIICLEHFQKFTINRDKLISLISQLGNLSQTSAVRLSQKNMVRPSHTCQKKKYSWSLKTVLYSPLIKHAKPLPVRPAIKYLLYGLIGTIRLLINLENRATVLLLLCCVNLVMDGCYLFPLTAVLYGWIMMAVSKSEVNDLWTFLSTKT